MAAARARVAGWALPSAAAALVVFAAAGALAFRHAQNPTLHFADADNSSLTQRGAKIYLRQCASCHGRRLEGQALWQLVDKDRHRRAPAHDRTGHTWMHSDEDLFQMTKYGRFGQTSTAGPSTMPAFERGLSDDEILATLAFIKARWPTGLRVMQAQLNPGQAGMPSDAANADWTLPANCVSPTQANAVGTVR